MAHMLVFAETKNGKIKKASLEILTSFVANGHKVSALLIGSDVRDITKEATSNGASIVYICQDSSLNGYNNERYLEIFKLAIAASKPDYLLAAHTPLGKDILPLVTASLDIGLASDCHMIQFKSADQIEFKRPVYSGKAIVKVEFIGTGLKAATIRPNSLPVAKVTAQNESVHTLTLPQQTYASELMEVVKGNSTRLDVTEASIVISGGRSLKTAENFKILEDLADLVQGAVGASRAAVDAGLRPHRDQVGQTGKVVSPLLYIACGISGAIQHLAGMRTSKIIVAINTDPDAAIYQVADYGIVADLFVILPLLTQEIKKLKE